MMDFNTAVITGVALAVGVIVLIKVVFGSNKGTKVARVADIKPGKMLEVKVGKNKVLLVHTKKGKIHAVGAKCTHFKAPMAKGVLCGERLVCPWHGACFNVETGDIEDGPVLDALPTFRVTVSGGDIYVNVPPQKSVPSKRTPHMCKAVAGNTEHFVIVGAGPAGGAAAEMLRQKGFTGRVTMISKEEALPYDRTKMSKAMTATAEEAQLRNPQFYADIDVDVQLGKTVTAVDVKEHILTCDSGSPIKYDKLLVATGGPARSFQPHEGFSIKGADLRNIHVLREANHALDITGSLSAFGDSVRVAIVGSSFIGMEAAAFLAKNRAGASITVIGMESEPFERVLGARIGAFMRQLHEANGVEFHMNSVVTEFQGDGAVSSLLLKNGSVVPCDVVIIGAGIIPATSFLRDTPLTLSRDGAVETNEFLEAGWDVFAAGDIVRFPFLLATHESSAKIRIEHWDVAMDQGRVAAQNMMGQRTAYNNVPFFWTAQYGKSLRYAGNAMTHDSQVTFGSMADGPKSSFTTYFLNGDVVSAVATFNADPQAVAAMELFRLQKMPSRAMLKASTNFDLVAFMEEQS